MQAFTVLESVVMPMDRSNVDTDAIIPKQFLKTIARTGLGKNLFFDWRYKEDGSPNPDFVLNDPLYQGTKILLARENFGCGSSREHAPWALLDYGFRCIIAPSFADIFFSNCFKNGILPVVLPADDVDRLFRDAAKTPGFRVSVDLASQTVITQDGAVHSFQIDPFRKECLLNGLDEIGLTLRHEPEIAAYEARRRAEIPWLFTRT